MEIALTTKIKGYTIEYYPNLLFQKNGKPALFPYRIAETKEYFKNLKAAIKKIKEYDLTDLS